MLIHVYIHVFHQTYLNNIYMCVCVLTYIYVCFYQTCLNNMYIYIYS